jgi:putative Holliday junction resolvase
MMPRLHKHFTLAALMLLPCGYGFVPSPPFYRQTPIGWKSHVIVASAMDLKQRPGESDIDFIRRITSSSDQKDKHMAFNGTNNSTENKPRGTYKRIEEWDEERKASGELTWEEKVQFEGQRFGNRVKQNDILSKHIGTFFFRRDDSEHNGGTASWKNDMTATEAVLDPRDFDDRSHPIPLLKNAIFSLQKRLVRDFLSSYISRPSLVGIKIDPPSKNVKIHRRNKQQQWSVDLSRQKTRRFFAAFSSVSASSRLTSESSFSPPPSTKILNNAIQDAAASFTQNSCRLLGVKSIGVDYGLVKTGVAVTVGYNPKPLEILVWERPVRSKTDDDTDTDDTDETPVLGNVTQIASQVVQITKREQASQIILGLPLHRNGTVAEQTNHTRVFAQELALQTLQQLGPDVPVFLWDERYTSKEAAARAHSKDPNRYLYGTLDSEAACIILEHYYHDNGLGAERVLIEDEALVQKYAQEWEQRVRLEEERLLQQERDRQDRLNRRKETMLRDQLLEAGNESASSSKRKKKKNRKR